MGKRRSLQELAAYALRQTFASWDGLGFIGFVLFLSVASSVMIVSHNTISRENMAVGIILGSILVRVPYLMLLGAIRDRSPGKEV